MNKHLEKPAISAKSVVARRKSIANPDAWKVDAAGFASLALLSALTYLGGVNPLMARHAAVRAQQTELIAGRAKSVDIQRAIAMAKEQLTHARQQLAASPLLLQPVAGLNQRLALVSDLAAHGGAGLDDVQPGKPEAGAQYDALPIHVAGSGTFPAFTGMLHRLREEFPDIGISGLDIAGNPQVETDIAKFSVDLLWYTEPTRSARRPAGKPIEPVSNNAVK